MVPTNTVTTGDGVTVRTRIDPTLTVDDVVKQLCLNLKIKDPPTHFALRDETDELVTNDNLRKKIKNKVNLKWVPLQIYVRRRLTDVVYLDLSMRRLVKPEKLQKNSVIGLTSTSN